MMQTVELAGGATSRIGLGCGRLVGGAGMKSSRAIVEAALTLGIRHFDTAPSYGMGTADDVLGDVLEGISDVTIVTKVGQQRPTSPGLRTRVRQVLRPALAWAPGIKARLARAGGGGLTAQFAPAHIEQSCAESLRRLRRDKVTGVLLHEIPKAQMDDDVASAMCALLHAGLCDAIGSGTGDGLDDLVPFGTIAQFRWSPGDAGPPEGRAIVHGVLRYGRRPATLAARERELLATLGRDPADPSAWPGAALTFALASQPAAIVLVSSTSAARLQQAVTAIDWSLVAQCPGQSMDAMRDLLACASDSGMRGA